MITFLLILSLAVNVTVGGIAYLAIRESQKCRHETARAHAALREVLGELVRIKELSRPIREVNPITQKPFAVIVGRALANYELSVAA